MKRLLKLEKITEATVEILDRFQHSGFSAFQGPGHQPILRLRLMISPGGLLRLISRSLAQLSMARDSSTFPKAC
jgi:hypothetical protein